MSRVGVVFGGRRQVFERLGGGNCASVGKTPVQLASAVKYCGCVWSSQ